MAWLAEARTWVADALTLSNGIFGFLSIVTWSVELGPLRGTVPDPIVAAAYIGLGMIADGLDGIVARVWGSTGLGNALDSICDAITFSVAPAVFLLEMNEQVGGPAFRTALSLAAVAFVLAGMLRLARHQSGEHADAFQGLPTPWGAATLVVLLLLGVPGWWMIGATVAIAGLNLSNVPYPKTRGAYTKATLAILAVSVLVIAGLVVTGTDQRIFLGIGVAVAIGMVVLAPAFART